MSRQEQLEVTQSLRNEYETLVDRVADREAIVASRESDHLEELDRQANVALILAGMDSRWRKRKEIGLALKRLADSEYGLCVDCDQEISPKRLEALPCATLCRDCQQVREEAIAAPKAY